MAPGPTSVAGKVSVSRNAVKHGLSGYPELTPSERSRWRHIRQFVCELLDEPENFESDIDECTTAQVLLERTIVLRHAAIKTPAPSINELEKLIRFETKLTRRRNKLLSILDVDEYADVDSSVWPDTS